MGLKLQVNCCSGAGKVLVRRVIEFCKVPHIITIRSSSVTKTLLINVYEPRFSNTMRVRMSPFHRDLLFGTMSDDVKAIFEPLTKRLKYDWRGKHAVFFDFSVYL